MLQEQFSLQSAHAKNDYFSMLRTLFTVKEKKTLVEKVYQNIFDEIITNSAVPAQPISFGTSGWRGILGKEVTVKTVVQVTRAIIRLYEGLEEKNELADLLGVHSLGEAQKRGCVVGFDNRFAGEFLGVQVVKVLAEAGFSVFYAGETTTGLLSAVVVQKQCAFSINLTPSHNPFQYGGYKFNAADAGPAATPVTEEITTGVQEIVAEEEWEPVPDLWSIEEMEAYQNVSRIDSFASWEKQVAAGEALHGVSLAKTMSSARENSDFFLAVDCVHGASRLHLACLYGAAEGEKVNLELLRSEADVTFGGVAPEPSTKNMEDLVALLKKRPEKLKLGAIIDPDGDRIRFTDGQIEISMNQFGAMVYHYLHEIKGKKGLAAKTVATSNLVNALAAAFDEEVFETAVGFKNFKPVMGKALVFFEESDGISILGHTAEKDAYIGLLLALAMVLETGKPLGEYLQSIEEEYGRYFFARDGIAVSFQKEELSRKLAELERFSVGSFVSIGKEKKEIVDVITIDGRKMIFADGSWLMIRPSGTEPKVRFYVESRTVPGVEALVVAAKGMLVKAGVIPKTVKRSIAP